MSGATTGKIGIISKNNLPCLLNQRVGKFEIISKDFYWKYLLFFIKSKRFQNKVLSSAGGCAQPNISSKQIESLKIPLPFLKGKLDLEKQKQIVAVLENLEKQKEKRKKTINLSDEYLKSIFNERFVDKGFEEKRLKEICELNPKKSEIKSLNENIEVSFVPMEYVNENQIYFNSKQTKKLKEVFSGYTYFKEGDVILAKVTPCFENGKSAICRNLKNKIGFGSSEFYVLRPSLKVIPEFIYFIISKESFKKLGKKFMTGTSGLRRLPIKYVENFKIPLPPIELQKEFASIVEKVEKLKEEQKQSLEKIEELFNSSLSKAFAGELI